MRILLLLIAVVLVLGTAELAACGSSSAPTTASAPTHAQRVRAHKLRELAQIELTGGRRAIARHNWPQAAFWMKQARATIAELHQLIYGD